MFYVCVICMVHVKRHPLMELTTERRQLWERIISPGINITRLQESLLLVCSECNQLLDSMLKFRWTMDVGVTNLLRLYKKLKTTQNAVPSVQQLVQCHELPTLIGADAHSLLLPVVSEEVVNSSEPWIEVEAAASVATKHDVIKPLPPLYDHRALEPGEIRFSDANQDYAVLIPINEDTTLPNLLCEEEGLEDSSISGTSKVEEAAAIPEDTKMTRADSLNSQDFSSASQSSEGKKIKLNRQLFEAIRVTLQSPSLTEEFDIKYEPESAFELGGELAGELADELGGESAGELGGESPDSDSTLSCQSDYEDPEHFPNIIFAQAFHGVTDNGPLQIMEGLAEDAQIHSHIVTNPPSEWPCTWERCRLQRFHDEDEDPKTPTETWDGPMVRSKRKADAPRRSKCKLCGKNFAKIYTLWKHYERQHMAASLKCDVCRVECRNETELKYHKIKHKFKSIAEFEEASRRHACLECGVHFRGNTHLQTHLDTPKHATRVLWRFQCDTCKRKFPDKKRIAEHIERDHLAKEAVKCPMCSVSFSSARSLRRHAASHILEAQAQANTHERTGGQARKRIHATYASIDHNYADTVANEANGHTHGTFKRPRKMKRQQNTHTDRIQSQANARKKRYSQVKRHARQDTHTYTCLEQDDVRIELKNRQARDSQDTQTDAIGQGNMHTQSQTIKQARKTTRQVKTYTNRKHTHTDTYMNGQAPTHTNGERTHTHTSTGQVNIHADTYLNIFLDKLKNVIQPHKRP